MRLQDIARKAQLKGAPIAVGCAHGSTPLRIVARTNTRAGSLYCVEGRISRLLSSRIWRY